MRRGCSIAVVALWAILSGCVAVSERAEPAPLYVVTRVVDGDTIEITDAGGIRTRVRLRRVNAPEKGQPGYEDARDALAARLMGRIVDVTPHARDRYGRLIADVVPKEIRR